MARIFKITEQQKRFADFWLDSGNAKQSAIDAGYSPTSAQSTGCTLLRNSFVRKYIDTVIAKQDKERIAPAREVLEFLTKGMRGEIKDQFGLDPTLYDRIDCAKQLQKRYGLDKVAIVGGEKGDSPVAVKAAVQIYLPDNGRDGNLGTSQSVDAATDTDLDE